MRAAGTHQKALLWRHGLSLDDPPPTVMQAAAAIDIAPLTAEIDRRCGMGGDRRSTFCFTIDSATTRDMDDALSIESTGTGWTVGVHIADVGHWVRRGDPLDNWAAKRGSTKYLHGQVLGMLPSNLGDHTFSLLPDHDRLALSLEFAVQMDGRMGACELTATVVRSSVRLTYDEVDEWLCAAEASQVAPSTPAVGACRTLRSVTDAMRAVGAAPRGRGAAADSTARELVSAWMELANQQVAKVLRAKCPDQVLLRLWRPPSLPKIERWLAAARAAGLTAAEPADDEPPHRALQRAYVALSAELCAPGTTLRRREELEVLEAETSRSGLFRTEFGGVSKLDSGELLLPPALGLYASFTSPIRRYADLLTHRLLWSAVLPGVGAHTVPLADALTTAINSHSHTDAMVTRAAAELEVFMAIAAHERDDGWTPIEGRVESVDPGSLSFLVLLQCCDSQGAPVGISFSERVKGHAGAWEPDGEGGIIVRGLCAEGPADAEVSVRASLSASSLDSDGDGSYLIREGYRCFGRARAELKTRIRREVEMTDAEEDPRADDEAALRARLSARRREFWLHTRPADLAPAPAPPARSVSDAPAELGHFAQRAAPAVRTVSAPVQIK